MDKYQKAAKLLNSKAPVDGPLGKERIAYLNPLEEEILKSIGGSGEVIIPSAEEQEDPNVPSYGAFKWIKKKIFDDILGIDENKFFGMGNHTFLGGALNKVWDDWLGIDSGKTFGINDATWDDLLPVIAGFALGPTVGPMLGVKASTAGSLVSMGTSVLDKVIENNSGDTSGRQMQREEFAALTQEFKLAQAKALGEGQRIFSFQGQQYYTDDNDDGSARFAKEQPTQPTQPTQQQTDPNLLMTAGSTKPGSYDEEGLANIRALTSALAGRGKGPILDPSDTGRMGSLVASPGDANYIEGYSLGGTYMDPFPSWLRDSGDVINDTINNTGKFANDYIGTEDQRMYDFLPILDRMKGMNLDAMSTLGSIFDRGDGGLESQYRGFQDDFNTLAEGQKLLNTVTAESNQGLVDNVLGAGDQYSDSLANAKNLQTSLTNQSFDALSSLEDIKRMQNMERADRFADTRDSRQDAAMRLSDAEYGAATGLSDSEYGSANRLFGARSDEADNIFGAEMGAADRIKKAEQAKALAAGANAERLANSTQRGMRSSLVGQGTGTLGNMGNAMIRAQLGQDRGDLLADALIRDADRRGTADIDFAGRMGDAGVDLAKQLGDSDVGLAGRLGQSNINLADRVGGAETRYRDQLEDILYSDADKLGAEIEADRFATLAEQNPGEAETLRSEANLQNQLRALGYGDQILNGLGANIGVDQATLDDERKLLSDLTNMRLGNTSLIPALGMQNAQLPSTLLEAALAPMGPLIRNTSPFTTTGQLPAPVTTFSPIAPPQQKNEWYDYAMMAPQVLSGIKGITDIWGEE
jgi:hypothetical protein